MVAKRKNIFTKTFNNTIFRLYIALIWRYLLWLLLLNLMSFIFFEGAILLMMNKLGVSHSSYVFSSIRIFLHVFIYPLVSFYLALESLMAYGFKSGRYKLVVESTSKKEIID